MMQPTLSVPRVIQFAKIQCSSLKHTLANADIFHLTPAVMNLAVLLFVVLAIGSLHECAFTLNPST
jgi:hypothetical protein